MYPLCPYHGSINFILCPFMSLLFPIISLLCMSPLVPNCFPFCVRIISFLFIYYVTIISLFFLHYVLIISSCLPYCVLLYISIHFLLDFSSCFAIISIFGLHFSIISLLFPLWRFPCVSWICIRNQLPNESLPLLTILLPFLPWFSEPNV